MNYAPDLTTAAIKMVLSLALVLAILWMIYRWTRRAVPGGLKGSGRLVNVLGSHYLGVKKSISIVQVPGTVLVLGISSDRINLLTRIDDPALVESLSRTPVGPSAASFKDQLQRMLRPTRSGSGLEAAGINKGPADPC